MAEQNEQNDDALAGAFETYKQNSKMLASLLQDVEEAYRNMPSLVKENLSDLLLSDKDKDKVTRTLQKPSIIFVGQTNSGKSSLINEILGATVVQASDTPGTARIVQLSYGDNDKPIIQVRDKNGKHLETKKLTSPHIPSSVVNLKKEDRHNADLVQSKVLAKINNPFLKSGVNIIDTPGKNENDQLDKLVDEHMNSVLPLVVCVIDGTNLLTTQEVSDISSLRRYVPHGNMFFVVTKCDTDPDYESSDEEQNSTKDFTKPTNIEIKIREGVYNKLQKEFVDLRITKGVNYHTLSSRRVKECRNAIRSQTSASAPTPYQRYLDDFNSFKACLLDFTRQQLIQTVTDSAKVVQLSLMKCLDYFIVHSNKMFDNRLENENNIKLIKAEGEKMSEVLQKLVTDATEEFSKAATAAVERNRIHIIKKAYIFKYVEYKVPSDGYIKSELVGNYKSELSKEILNEINGIILRDVVNKDGKLDKIFKDVAQRLNEVQKTIGSKIPIDDVLQQMFGSNYKFSLDKLHRTKSLWENIKGNLKKIWDAITLKALREKIRGVNVTDEPWKRSVAEEILEAVKKDNVAEHIVKGILDYIQNGQDNFQDQLVKLRELCEQRISLGERDREVLRKMAPIIGRLELRSWNIIDQLRFTDVKYGKELGKGAQGVVLECDAKGPNCEECVAKVIKLESENELGDVSLELHYSRKLDHKHIVKIVGTIYKSIQGKMYELAIIMPRLKSDLKKALPELPQLSLRLQIALQIASALSYVHHAGLMHRDIKAANILLDINYQAKITDFGFCKPPNFSDGSVVGTPMHMAPEIIINVLSKQLYSSKVDVYAFGILLWYVCEGTGNNPNNLGEGVQSLLTGALVGRRPERLIGFRDDCWHLMQKCWAEKPDSRPDMDAVTNELSNIVLHTLRNEM